MFKSLACNCGVFLVNPNGKVARRALAHFDGNRLMLKCLRCKSDLPVASCAEIEPQTPRRGIKLVYVPSQ